MCVTLTPAAATYMRRMVRFGEGTADCGFRLTVKAGGCSGFDSSFTIEAAPQADDTVVEQHGARLFLTKASCELLRGFTIDFAESRLDGGLTFTNPGAPHVCGCGAGEPSSKSGVVFMRPTVGCVKKPAG